MKRVRQHPWFFAAAVLILVLSGCFASRKTLTRAAHEAEGRLVTLDERVFSKGVKITGLWKAERYFSAIGVPAYQTVEHDPSRLPVLLVHGYNDNAKGMAYLAKSLDPDKFEPVYANYPSGLDIDKISRGLLASVEELTKKKKIDAMAVAAFSMGGLAARKFLGYWGKKKRDTAIVTYVSMAAPYGGIEVGSKLKSWRPYEPESWNDIALGSEFLDHLYDDPLPQETAFHLVYALSEVKEAVPGYDDGIVSMESATRKEAAAEAATVSQIMACDHGQLLKKKEPVMKMVELLLKEYRKWNEAEAAVTPAVAVPVEAVKEEGEETGEEAEPEESAGDEESGGKNACSKGGCSFTCPKGQACSASCSGGECRQTCKEGATCRFTCSGGECAQECGADSACQFYCSGGSCVQTCLKGAACVKSCEGGYCTE
jgi:pimeloyl-ACP methyl ester carboxylesterase